jgi:uncharacterized protein (DUF2147 family)
MKKTLISVFLMIMLVALALPTFLGSQADTDNPADRVLGKWIQYDDKTGDLQSKIRIFKDDDGTYAGRIVWTIPPEEGEDPPTVKGRKYNNQPVLGFKLLWDLKYYKGSGKWEHGKIYDPTEGKEYGSSLEIVKKSGKDGKLEYEPGDLCVRGWVLFFNRAQYWKWDEDQSLEEWEIENKGNWDKNDVD